MADTPITCSNCGAEFSKTFLQKKMKNDDLRPITDYQQKSADCPVCKQVKIYVEIKGTYQGLKVDEWTDFNSVLSQVNG